MGRKGGLAHRHHGANCGTRGLLRLQSLYRGLQLFENVWRWNAQIHLFKDPHR